MELASLSANLLLVSFIAYLIATMFFGGAVRGQIRKPPIKITVGER